MFRDLISLFFIPGDVVLRIFLSLTSAIILGFFIAMLYRNTHRGLNYEPSFLATLVLIPPIVTMIMLFIRGDLVLSLGLVGSLSIIRFRTPIKDTRDMVYLFWVIAVGLGCGTDNWTLVFIATIFLAIIVSSLYVFEYGRPKHSDYVLVISGKAPYPAMKTQEIIKMYASDSRVRSHQLEEDNFEVIFELRFLKIRERTANNLIQDLRSVEGVSRVSLLAPQLALPM